MRIIKWQMILCFIPSNWVNIHYICAGHHPTITRTFVTSFWNCCFCVKNILNKWIACMLSHQNRSDCIKWYTRTVKDGRCRNRRGKDSSERRHQIKRNKLWKRISLLESNPSIAKRSRSLMEVIHEYSLLWQVKIQWVRWFRRYHEWIQFQGTKWGLANFRFDSNWNMQLQESIVILFLWLSYIMNPLFDTSICFP